MHRVLLLSPEDINCKAMKKSREWIDRTIDVGKS